MYSFAYDISSHPDEMELELSIECFCFFRIEKEEIQMSIEQIKEAFKNECRKSKFTKGLLLNRIV